MILAASFSAADAGILVAVLVLLICSAALALAETSLVRTNKARARALLDQKRHGARSLLRLVEDPEKFLAPVLLMVLICQIVVTTLVTVVASNLFGGLGVVVATFFDVVVIFVAAEAVPKNWAIRQADRAALLAAPLVSTIVALPPVKVISTVLIGTAHFFTPGRGTSAEAEVTETELLAFADVALEERVIEREERALISSIIEFGDTIVREVMAPRPDIVAVESDRPVAEVLEKAITLGLSRLPVYTKSLDDVIGIAYTRDLMRAARRGDEARTVREFAREATYVPETKRIAPLLREMQASALHIAIVVDEYGGTAGIVTLEDLIEELVGEIADEFDVDDPLVEPLGDDEYRVSAKMAVDEINELLSVELPVGDWDTVGGLLLHLLGHIPKAGESARIGDLVLSAEKVQGHRIGQVRILKLANEHAQASESDRQ